MIEFPCICGYAFEVPEELSGSEIQCPECRRLCDVPTHTELKQIELDGTYKMDEPAPLRDPDEVVADLTYIYQKGVRDADGNEIDLRLTPEERGLVGIGEPIPLDPDAKPMDHAPRYDPETGELIEPIELQDSAGHAPPVDPSTIPMAKAVFNYATGEAARRPGFFKIFVHLFAPLNLAVMLGIYCIHALLWPLLVVCLAGIMFLVVATPFLIGAILAHYGCIIEDAGPFERDELPRPLRDVGWYEDLWAPFCNVFGSLLLCYGAVVLLPLVTRGVPEFEPIAWAMQIALGAIGTYFFPAVLLTLQTSGTVLNLRPDRLMGVIIACGRDYFLTLIIWVIAGGLYAWGWVGSALALTQMLVPMVLPVWLSSFALTAAVLALGIFGMHYFCMILGMLYRLHYDRFPWIFQRHISARKAQGFEPVGLPPSRRRRRNWNNVPPRLPDNRAG
ncbi:MAG TPA: hypothetical protein VGI81_05020 [Tepidisphaeraceae bacterium]